MLQIQSKFPWSLCSLQFPCSLFRYPRGNFCPELGVVPSHPCFYTFIPFMCVHNSRYNCFVKVQVYTNGTALHLSYHLLFFFFFSSSIIVWGLYISVEFIHFKNYMASHFITISQFMHSLIDGHLGYL